MVKLQDVIERGILEEEPDGMVYLSAKARDVISYIEGDAGIMAALERKATDDADKQMGFWTLVFMEYCGEVTTEEVSEGVQALMAWHQAAKDTAQEDRLNEWSMTLRLRE